MQVVILERNKLVGRKVARRFMAAGASAVAIEDPARVSALLDGANVLCADAFDGDLVTEQVRARGYSTATPGRRARSAPPRSGGSR